MTAPAPQGPEFVRHNPSVKHTNADDATSFTMFCFTSFPSSCASAILFLRNLIVSNKMVCPRTSQSSGSSSTNSIPIHVSLHLNNLTHC